VGDREPYQRGSQYSHSLASLLAAFERLFPAQPHRRCRSAAGQRPSACS
jgi:hypothetical protein